MTNEVEFRQVYDRLCADGSDLWDVEVKRAAGGVPDVAETLCAFGNMPEGGTIIFGLDESARFAPVGVSDPVSLERAVASQARKAVEPAVQVEFWRMTVDGRTLVIANVAGLPSHSRPCHVKKSKRAYLRFADGDYTLSAQEIQQILSNRERPRNDIAVVDGSTRHDLDPDLTERFLTRARSASRRLSREDDEQVLRMKRVLEVNGDRLTVAGLYALGRYPQQFLPSLALSAVLRPQPGINERNADRREFDGPLPEILDDAVQWVVRNIRTKVRFGADGHGADASEVPVVAVREIIANALVHRDLSQHTWGKEVQLSLDSDRLVVANPGGLWGLTVDQLGTGNSKSAVNEFLYEICQLTTTPTGNRVIEGEGGGLREVRSSLRRAGMEEPKFHDSGVKFTAIIPRHSLLTDEDFAWLSVLPHHEDLTDMQRQVLVSMRRGQTWTNQRMRDEFGPLDSTEARALLQRLVSFGLAEMTGGGRATSYRLEETWAEGTEEVAPQVNEQLMMGTSESRAGQRSDRRVAPEELRDLEQEAQRTSRHGRALWESLIDGPKSVHEIGEAADLEVGKVRYGLRRLLEAGLVLRDGGQGHRLTTYRRLDASGS